MFSQPAAKSKPPASKTSNLRITASLNGSSLSVKQTTAHYVSSQ